MRERQEFLDRYFVFSGPDYEPPMDYSRTRGLIGEILIELDLLDEQRKLMAESALKPQLTHEARPAVGQAPEGAMNIIEPENSEGAPAPDGASPVPSPFPQTQGAEGGPPQFEPPPQLPAPVPGPAPGAEE